MEADSSRAQEELKSPRTRLARVEIIMGGRLTSTLQSAREPSARYLSRKRMQSSMHLRVLIQVKQPGTRVSFLVKDIRTGTSAM